MRWLKRSEWNRKKVVSVRCNVCVCVCVCVGEGLPRCFGLPIEELRVFNRGSKLLIFVFIELILPSSRGFIWITKRCLSLPLKRFWACQAVSLKSHPDFHDLQPQSVKLCGHWGTPRPLVLCLVSYMHLWSWADRPPDPEPDPRLTLIAGGRLHALRWWTFLQLLC